ncbi:MAG: hypothetical protein ACM3SQ_19480 [Betaproteobacteria bacterium]
MKKTTSIIALVAAGLVAGASGVHAQTLENRIFLSVDVGAQVGSHSVNTNTSFPLYDETATVTSSQKVGAGPVIDFGGNYRVWRNLALGLMFTTFSRTVDGSLSATVPSPIFFNRPTTVNVTTPGLKHSEFGTHIQALYYFPVGEKLDLAIYGGPSIVHLSQDIPTATVPAGTQNTNVSVSKAKGTAAGGNVGAEISYMLTSRYGAGFYMRYAGGSVDLPTAKGVKVGGFQVGGGIRVRF